MIKSLAGEALPLLYYAVLFFLLPLGLYCLALANLNRRDRPVLLPGSWDCLGALLAGSGFFLALVPTIFVLLYQRSVVAVDDNPLTFNFLWARWWLIWLLYYLVLIAGALYLISWRSRKSVIYNVDTELFPALFAHAIQRVGLSADVRPDRPGHFVIVQPAPPKTAITAEPLADPGPPVAPPLESICVVEVDAFPVGCHVTLDWQPSTVAVRPMIEQELNKLLPNARPADNPMAGWFIAVGSLILGLILLLIAALVFAPHLARHWPA